MLIKISNWSLCNPLTASKNRDRKSQEITDFEICEKNNDT